MTELAHAGVKGMKWGVRKDRSADSQRSESLRKRGAANLSNKELREVNERLNLEKNFNKMSPTKIQRGKTAAKATLALATAGVTVYNMYNSPAGKAAVSLGKKILKR